jgi:cyclopropane-fatty-acyl-phospholipid synthase
MKRPIALPLPESTSSGSTQPDHSATDWKLSRWQRKARAILVSGLHHLQDGQLRFHDAEHDANYGTGELTSSMSHLGAIPAVQIQVLNPQFYTDLLLGGSMAAAETYIRGWWRTNDLPNTLRLMLRNQAITDVWDQGQSWWKKQARHFAHWLQRNTVQNSRKNIVAHYDLGNDFYALMLDPTMAYSSAFYAEEQLTLEQAQRAKFERLCRLLDLKATDHLLEIGTGWGGLAIYAAQEYGCRITTTTISPSQREYAQQKIAAAGLSDRITVLATDYRELTGQYDKLVSVEMLEAVGHQFFDTYFRKCGQLLKPGGKFALQTITIADQRFESYKKSVDFIQKYVFPGGCLPSVTALSQAVTRTSNLRITQLHDFGLDYARTLVAWRERFVANLDKVRTLGYPETFIRLWEFYLAYCEAGFRERATGVIHAVLE